MSEQGVKAIIEKGRAEEHNNLHRLSTWHALADAYEALERERDEAINERAICDEDLIKALDAVEIFPQMSSTASPLLNAIRYIRFANSSINAQSAYRAQVKRERDEARQALENKRAAFRDALVKLSTERTARESAEVEAEQLRAALAPLASIPVDEFNLGHRPNTHILMMRNNAALTLGDVRRARKALAGEEESWRAVGTD